MLKTGVKAPDFTLTDKNGNEVSLTDFRGKKIVLYFYPKDNTSGCTKQALGFADLNGENKKSGAVVIGISRDSAKSHAGFAEKYGLPFVLLSDPEHKVTEQYGAWQEKKLYGKISMGVVRTTFVIDEDGTIIKVFEKASASLNPYEVVEFLKK